MHVSDMDLQSDWNVKRGKVKIPASVCQVKCSTKVVRAGCNGGHRVDVNGSIH